MDHDATREELELAAVEPGGLDRLMAGDTATAQAVAAHLAGCPSCTDELRRIELASRLIRNVVSASPPADLRERTLAIVRATGIPRADTAGAVTPPPAVPADGAPPDHRGRRRAALGWVAAIAAAVVVSVIATSVIVGGRVDERLAAQAGTIEALQDVALATLQVSAEPDVRRVALAGTDPGLSGNLIFSPSTSELVVVATGLTEPPAGQEYRCWVEQAGNRQRVGKMFFTDDLAYWVGPAPAVAGLVDGATFGVSLVSIDGTSVDTQPVLDGGL
jgi:hypothetical protein